MRGHLVMVQYSAHPYLHKIIHFFFTDFYKVKVKGFNFYYCYSESSPNGNPHYISRQLCARTCTNTKLCFSQLPYKLFIFIFPLAASTCYRHLFCVPMVSANENFHCTGSSERVNFWMRQTRKFYSPWWATSGELILSSKTLAHTSSGIASPLSKISCAFPPSSVCSSIPWFIISEPV